MGSTSSEKGSTLDFEQQCLAIGEAYQRTEAAVVTRKADVVTKKGSSKRYPYGKCRCGEAILFPGLDRYKCSKCGWRSRKGQS